MNRVKVAYSGWATLGQGVLVHRFNVVKFIKTSPSLRTIDRYNRVMFEKLRIVGKSLRNNGLIYTSKEIILHFLGDLMYGIYFAIWERQNQNDKTDIAIVIRQEKPESDTFSLLDELKDKDEARTLHILSSKEIDTTQLDLWDDSLYTTARTDTREAFAVLSKSQTVICKQNSHLKWYRIFDTSDRTYIRLYHGPITKAYGRSASGSSPRKARILPSVDSGMKYRSVASETERYFRSSSEGRHPDLFPIWGYPRFDRVKKLASGAGEPVLPDETTSLLENTTYNILYAPTQKDGEYLTTFFPFDEFDVDHFSNWCHEHDVRLYLRPHPSRQPKVSHLINDERIIFADQSFANSATELMPFIDGLITDYSSIYLEYLPFDRPIVFVRDRHERFLHIRGLAFDIDRYFPGEKPATYQAFLNTLENALAGNDGLASDRQFVRETFIPELDQSFLEYVLEGANSDIDTFTQD